MRFDRPIVIFHLGCLILLTGCGSTAPVNERPVGAVIQISAPLGLPPVPVPSGNPTTKETRELGRALFYEKMLSADGSLACASCHDPLSGFADSRRQSVGVGGKLGSRNAPTLINAVYVEAQFWDGRARSLEEQAGGPMANPVEMNQTHDVSVSKLQANTAYKAAFDRAFGPGPVTIGKVENAIASFERTLISGGSAFDRYEFGGDKTALSPGAIRGLAIFRDKKKGNCTACHTIDQNYALFTDGKFHNIGVSVDAEGELVDLGRFNQSQAASDKGAFKTPTLRNVALTAPYMHDGSLKTLRRVVDFYAGGGNSNPYLDKEIKPIELSGRERADLVEFLESLTGNMPPDAGPPGNGRL